MNATKSKLIFHLIAIVTVIIWGTTFVSTKILIQNGLTPSEIFFYRFVLAYICMWSISRKKFFANSIKDEFFITFSRTVWRNYIFFLLKIQHWVSPLLPNVSLNCLHVTHPDSFLIIIFLKEMNPLRGIYFMAHLWH